MRKTYLSLPDTPEAYPLILDVNQHKANGGPWFAITQRDAYTGLVIINLERARLLRDALNAAIADAEGADVNAESEQALATLRSTARWPVSPAKKG